MSAPKKPRAKRAPAAVVAPPVIAFLNQLRQAGVHKFSDGTIDVEFAPVFPGDRQPVTIDDGSDAGKDAWVAKQELVNAMERFRTTNADADADTYWST